MSPQAEAVAERLENTGLKWFGFSLATGIIWVVTLSLATLVLFVLADALLELPQVWLGSLFAVWAVLTAAAGVCLYLHLKRGPRSLAGVARQVEEEFPEVGSHLINLVQLSQGEEEGYSFSDAAVEQAATAVADVPFHRAAARESRRRRFVLGMQTAQDLAEAAIVLGAVVLAGSGLSFAVPRWSSSVGRLLHPWHFVPAVGSVQIVQVTPGDTEVLLGANVEVVGEIANPEHRAYPARLLVRRTNEPETAVVMQPDQAGQRYLGTVPQVLAPLRYRLEIGDSQSPVYSVNVCDKPTVAGADVTYVYPAYLERTPELVRQQHADLDAPQYTQAELRIHPSTPIVAGYLTIDGRRVNGEVVDDGQTLAVSLLLEGTTTYTIHLFTAAHLTDPEPRVNRIHVIPDAPPGVQLVEPAAESGVSAGGKTIVVVRASDDHGLGLVRVEWKTSEDGPVETLATWTRFSNGTSAVLQHPLVLDPKRLKPGQKILVRAVARDRRSVAVGSVRLEPQETATPWHALRVVAREVKSAADLAALEDLRARLWKILQEQLQSRTTAATITAQPADAARIAGQVRVQQVVIQKATVAVVELIGKSDDPERLVVKRVLSKLAYGAMLDAVRQAEALERDSPGSTQGLVGALTATQDRIIDVLRRLLNEVRKATAEVLAEMKKRPDTNLPPDVQRKLRDLKAKLDEFIKQQKKVIEATEELAKKPVEDFSDKDKRLLKDLAKSQDDWSRFMNERHTDLSKLPEQDLSNPSLLLELIEVHTQLKMAKDALTKKSADIAVPLEQMGVEKAKEMTTNIEKWLPDTPDRERWSQEEPVTDNMKEAPMAELPKELEDLVGKLMEQEEDLFDEMEDVSSKWADSIDKGAGWDAADGPISNNSARGVTGNRLPNTSEIAGRSGEGRQGKSSGEFVGAEAVGKGGRKTPSRLTPDPFVKGQVKDKSTDPVGGATGGGKESGQGGQGLRGPLPDRPERLLQRLAGKQAELRNKAEGLDLRFKVLRYHHTDLKKLIEQMAGVEQDLKAGRYRNALRRRDVLLDGLGQVKTYLKGEFTIRQDRTPNLPTDIQKEILGGMQEASPPGWEELNRQYFERLTTGK